MPGRSSGDKRDQGELKYFVGDSVLKTKLYRLVSWVLEKFGFELIHQISNQPVYNVDRVIDVGVADGTSHLLKNYITKYFIFVEPHPRYQEHIRKRLLNSYDGILLPFAVGNEDSQLRLSDNGLASGFMKRDDGSVKGEHLVDVKRLDSALREVGFFNSTESALLKIDTEGFEMNVLRGATDLLGSSFLKVIQVELRLNFVNTNYNPSDLFCFLNEYGFKFHRLDKVAHRKRGVSYLDVTFMKN